MRLSISTAKAISLSRQRKSNYALDINFSRNFFGGCGNFLYLSPEENVRCISEKQKKFPLSFGFSLDLHYLCKRFGDAGVFHPGMKRESGESPEQYPLLSSPLWKAHRRATESRSTPYYIYKGTTLGKADFSERARKPASRTKRSEEPRE